MRNKIKQLMKKEGGFTLIELLGVIVILGVIVAISIPLIGNVVEKAENDTEKSQKALVIDAAKMYELQNTIPDKGITTDELEIAGFLESNPDVSYTVTKKVGTDKKVAYEATKTAKIPGK